MGVKKQGTNLKQPLSRQVRYWNRAGAARSRAQKDIDAWIDAFLEAGHLSVSDLAGEISMLRSVMRRVFALASEESKELEALEQAQQQTEAQPGMAKSRRGEGRAKKGASGQEKYEQLPLLKGMETEEPDEDARRENLELWVQTLESLSRGTMRLANLMRTHQILNQGEGEADPDDPEIEPEDKVKQELKDISHKLEQAQSELSQDVKQRE